MEIYKSILIFIIGTIFGSFYNVIGYRIPKEESILFPSSHCPKCKHKLKLIELIPIISYIKQKGRCNECKEKISITYPLFEFLTGILFLISYYVFSFSQEYIIAITFISMLIIITISDLQYLIIPDKILLIFGILLIIEILLFYGINKALMSILSGTISFSTMFILKKIGDFIFKKESMGGGDIKLLFTFGLVLKFPISILSIFIGSIIGLPISIFLITKNKEHIMPFGPLLSAGALILLLTKIDMNTIINFYN